MLKGSKGSILVLIMVLFTFSVVACGGGSSSDSVTYSGSTDPAVADSTTAATLGEYDMGSLEAGLPVVSPFVMAPASSQAAISAQPQAWTFETTMVMPLPAEAMLYGSDYDEAGTGTGDLNGTLTLTLGSEDAEATTWYIDHGELNGNIVFDGFTPDGGPTVSGKVTIPSGTFYFAGADVGVDIGTGEWLNEPDVLVWLEVDMTFSNLTVTDEGDSWSLGQGILYLKNNPGIAASLDIESQTIEYDGDTYKVEDTNLYVDIEEGYVVFSISGTGIDENGTFYHPVLGVTWMSGAIAETDAEGIVEGELYFYDAVTEGNLVFTILFVWDDVEGATAYWIDLEDGSYDEFGYYVDGTFVEDASASSNFE